MNCRLVCGGQNIVDDVGAIVSTDLASSILSEVVSSVHMSIDATHARILTGTKDYDNRSQAKHPHRRASVLTKERYFGWEVLHRQRGRWSEYSIRYERHVLPPLPTTKKVFTTNVQRSGFGFEKPRLGIY